MPHTMDRKQIELAMQNVDRTVGRQTSARHVAAAAANGYDAEAAKRVPPENLPRGIRPTDAQRARHEQRKQAGGGAGAGAAPAPGLLAKPPGLKQPPALLPKPPGLGAVGAAGAGMAAAAQRSGQHSNLAGAHHAMKAIGGKNKVFGTWTKLLNEIKAFERAHFAARDNPRERQKLQRKLTDLIQRCEAYLASHQNPQGDVGTKRFLAVEHLLPRLREEILTLNEGLAQGRNQKSLVGDPRVLGKGGLNEVAVAGFAQGDDQQKQGVFKPARYPNQTTHSAKEKAARHDNERSMAVSKADRFLGTNTIAKTEYSALGDHLGIIMDLADGEEVEWVDSENVPFSLELDYDDPELQRQVTNLQWLDGFTGEWDRHGGNFMVKQGASGTKVTGIDNDGAFNPERASDLQYSLPPVVDAQLVAHLMRPECTVDAYIDTLKTVLQGPPLELARERFIEVKAHVEALVAEGRVVGAKDGSGMQWGTAETRAALMVPTPGRPEHYYARDVALLEKGRRTGYSRAKNPEKHA